MLDIDALAEETKKLLSEADWFAERADANRWAAAKNTYIACDEHGVVQREWGAKIGKHVRDVRRMLAVWRTYGEVEEGARARARSFDDCSRLVVASEERRDALERIAETEGVSVYTAEKRLRAEKVRQELSEPEVAEAVMADREARMAVLGLANKIGEATEAKRAAHAPRVSRSDVLSILMKSHDGIRFLAEGIADAELTDEIRDAAIAEITWQENALGWIKEGLRAGSMDDALSQILAG